MVLQQLVAALEPWKSEPVAPGAKECCAQPRAVDRDARGRDAAREHRVATTCDGHPKS